MNSIIHTPYLKQIFTQSVYFIWNMINYWCNYFIDPIFDVNICSTKPCHEKGCEEGISSVKMCICLQIYIILSFHFFFRYWQVRYKYCSSKNLQISSQALVQEPYINVNLPSSCSGMFSPTFPIFVACIDYAGHRVLHKTEIGISDFRST